MADTASAQPGLLNTAGPFQLRWAWLTLIGMTAIVGSALAFEHIGGYVPCALCLEQRNPYYIGIPLLAVGALAGLTKAPACILRGMLMIAFLCLLATAALGVYHAGVEWGFWPGPESCAAGLTGEAGSGNLLQSLQTSKPPACDEAAGRFLGLSFAGWNVVAALGLAFFTGRAAFGPAKA